VTSADSTCKGCGAKLGPDDRACPHCGRLVVRRERDRLRPGVEPNGQIPTDPPYTPSPKVPQPSFQPPGPSGPPSGDQPDPDRDGERLERDKGTGCSCLIVTAAYGSEYAPQVTQLKDIREAYRDASFTFSGLLDGFERVYYLFSPRVSLAMSRSPSLKRLIRMTLVAPTLTLIDKTHGWIMSLFQRRPI
jgi:hypothetical protein